MSLAYMKRNGEFYPKIIATKSNQLTNGFYNIRLRSDSAVKEYLQHIYGSDGYSYGIESHYCPLYPYDSQFDSSISYLIYDVVWRDSNTTASIDWLYVYADGTVTSKMDDQKIVISSDSDAKSKAREVYNLKEGTSYTDTNFSVERKYTDTNTSIVIYTIKCSNNRRILVSGTGQVFLDYVGFAS